MEFEKSCGAVIYRVENSNIEYLIISHKSDGHWGFPKGHVEGEELELETAMREVWEETGLKVNLTADFRYSVEYEPKPGVWKKVVFFLEKANYDTVNIQLDELKEYRWCCFEEAYKTLSYETSKEVLIEAEKFIRK